MSYNPKSYWETRDNPNVPGEDTAPKFWYNYVKPRLEGVTTVLEVGPGVGRILDFYTPQHKIKTIDLSTNYRELVRQKADALGLSLQQNFLDAPGDAFPFEDKEFDLCVCVQVLMHIPPDYISHTLNEIFRTSRKAVLISTIELPPAKRAAHVFEHDFKTLIANAGREISHYQAKGRIGCFTIV